MGDDTRTDTKSASHEEKPGLASGKSGLLIAYTPEGAASIDRCQLSDSFTVGRRSLADLSIRDGKVSKLHFRITKINDQFRIEDLGSRNGTYLDGKKIMETQPVRDFSLIRFGNILSVFCQDMTAMLTSPARRYGMVGSFHVAPILKEIEGAVISKRPILLTGPTGCGKELAANAVASMKGVPIIAHNAAVFSSEADASSVIFGVGKSAFTAVAQRPGLMELAEGKLLFIDEIHNLPDRVQKALLRVTEDGSFQRIGETSTRAANVTFVFASNMPSPTFGLPQDLLARTRVVAIPPLSERIADIPAIFRSVLTSRLSLMDIAPDEVLSLLSVNHYEKLCLDGFPNDNVRGLIDLADKISTQIIQGMKPSTAIEMAFGMRFFESGGSWHEETPPWAAYPDEHELPSSLDSTKLAVNEMSKYEQNRELIAKTYYSCQGNISKTKKLLGKYGLQTSREYLGIYIERWKLASKKETKRF